MEIADCIRNLSMAMDSAWSRQGGRSANNYSNPSPPHIQLPYAIASQSARAIGKAYQYTFSAMGSRQPV